jgi:hypothetical protein
MSARRAERKASPLFKIARVLVCFNHVVSTGLICRPAIKNDSGAILATRRTFLNWFPYDSWNPKVSLVVCLVKDHVPQFAFIHKLIAF